MKRSQHPERSPAHAARAR